jgi:hypothetical protein
MALEEGKMMSLTSTVEMIASMAWGDVELQGMDWIEGGRDLLLKLHPSGPATDAGQTRFLAFRWAHGLDVRLAFAAGRGGYPLTWDTTFEHQPDGTWSVLFDFAHAGVIRFIFNELDILSSESARDAVSG